MNVSRYSTQLLWLFSAAFLSYLAYRIFLVFSIQPDLGGVENAVVYFIQRTIADLPLYTNPELSPYAINQYGPLYFLLTSAIGKLLSIDSQDVQEVFILNRSVSLLLNLGMATLVTRTCSKILSLPAATGLSAGIMSFIFLEITSFARPDSLNHFLYLLSLYYFLCFQQKTTTVLLVLSAFFAAAALFTKQSSFTIPVIIAVWVLKSKTSRTTWTWFAAYIIFLILALLVLHFQYGLTVIYDNLVKGVNNGINLGLFWANIIKPFFTSFGLLWIPLACLVFVQTRKETSPDIRFLAWAMVIQFFISLALSLKFGSHVNYFTEFWVILFIAIAFYCNNLQKVFKNHLAHFPAIMLGLILVIKMLLISFPLYREVRFGNADRKLLYEKEKAIAAKIRSEALQEKVFNNVFSPHSFLNNFLFRQAILPQYEIVFFTTWDRQVYNYNDYRNQFPGNVKWIVTKNTDPVPSFKDFMIQGYEPVLDTAGYRIFRSFGNGIK